jgi:hypothetical protein
MSEDKRYTAILNGTIVESGHASLQPMRLCCLAVDPWLNSNNVLKIKFGDLIGSKSGGSDKAQRETLEKICTKLNIPFNKIERVANKLFGADSNTFRLGQINSWQQEIPSKK